MKDSFSYPKSDITHSVRRDQQKISGQRNSPYLQKGAHLCRDASRVVDGKCQMRIDNLVLCASLKRHLSTDQHIEHHTQGEQVYLQGKAKCFVREPVADIFRVLPIIFKIAIFFDSVLRVSNETCV